MYQLWVEGDVNLDLELQSALSEKNAQFKFSDVSVFKKLVQEHVTESEKKLAALGKAGPSIQAAQLERQAFDICLAGIQHDCELFKVWFTRNMDRESSVFFQQLQHKLARKNAAKEIAANVMDKTSPVWKVKVSNLTSAGECLQQFQAMRTQIMKLESLTQKDQVLVLVWLNWAAPSSFTSQEQTTQASLCGALVNSEAALGGVLTPVFFHRKGQVFKVEEQANKLLSGANLNSDGRFAVPFSGKNDEREKRTPFNTHMSCPTVRVI